MSVWIRHDNGAGWGRVLPSPSPYPILIYLPVTLPIPNGDEKLNLIPVPDGFGYPRPIPTHAKANTAQIVFGKRRCEKDKSIDKKVNNLGKRNKLSSST
ncbi:hypothetical protein MTR_1g089550 [Medicago truncatula]|uniref:Uncharacterized protein n=1 Tax=Medicago truncatula TaxID=3880 RepID=A0A072VN59_MEDTR|nr:hypothetical protein MTR_1g089550 [Medicago truncatula]